MICRLGVACNRTRAGVAALALLLTGLFLGGGPAVSSGAATVQPHASATCSQPGGLFAYGSQVVGIADTPDDGGYWIVNNAGQRCCLRRCDVTTAKRPR